MHTVQNNLIVINDSLMKRNCLIILIILNLLFIPSDAYAYLDPGTGSIIIQAVLAFFAAVGSVLSLYWEKFTNFFKKKSKEKDKIDPDKQ